MSFITAIQESVEKTLQQGLSGWRVPDAMVTLTRSGYWPRQSHAHGTFDKSMSSTAGDFRNLTPLVLIRALRRAGTVVCEPLHRLRLDLPADVFGSVLPVLSQLRDVPHTTATDKGSSVVEGDIPASLVHELQRMLPSLTRGEGVLKSQFHHYQEIKGAAPSRPRTDLNPLNRKEYLLRVQRGG